jgi:hypothetical protein
MRPRTVTATDIVPTAFAETLNPPPADTFALKMRFWPPL